MLSENVNNRMIKVFKFGGTSIKDAISIKKITSILKDYSSDDLVIVFSAIGKVTNMLEDLVEEYMSKNISTELKFFTYYISYYLKFYLNNKK